MGLLFFYIKVDKRAVDRVDSGRLCPVSVSIENSLSVVHHCAMTSKPQGKSVTSPSPTPNSSSCDLDQSSQRGGGRS